MKPADVSSLRMLRRARDQIDRDYAEPIGIMALAAGAGYSREHFIRAFRAAYGETPGRYRTRRRVERACELLRSANLKESGGSAERGAVPVRFKVFPWRIPSRAVRWPGVSCVPRTRTGTGWSSCCGCRRVTGG